MKLWKIYDKSKLIIIWSMVCLTLILLLCFPAECRNGATNGVFLCLQVLIPSLFPFMVLSDFVVRSGLCSRVPLPVKRFIGKIFCLPSDTAAVILLSFIGGYPVGAKGINSLLREKLINEVQAQRMSLFCVASGPGFLVTYLGAVMLGNTAVGYILLASQTISVIILGLLSRISITDSKTTDDSANHIAKLRTGTALTGAVSSAITSSAGMCGLVVLFAAFCEIFLSLSQNSPKLWGLAALIEITTGTKILAEGYSAVTLSAACGFGGLCVHFQIFQQLSSVHIPKMKFYIFRILQAVLSGGFTYVLLRIFPQSTAVFSSVSDAEPRVFSSTIGTVFLVLTCTVFLLSIKADNKLLLRR